MSKHPTTPTDQEISDITKLLEKLNAGFLPYPIFQEVARLVVMPIIDIVPVRHTESGSVEVLLTQREADDPFWPGMWHNPGTVVRASDKDPGYADAFRRVFIDELGLDDVQEPHFVTGFLHQTRRGSESTRVYWVELHGTPRVGDYFDITRLPKETIESHIGLIGLAAQAFSDTCM